jgi:hypothetical protein
MTAGAEVVGVEIAGEGGLVGVLDVDADEAPADDQVVGPAHAAAGAGEALGQHATMRSLIDDTRRCRWYGSAQPT